MIKNILLVDDDQVSNFVSKHKISKFNPEISVEVSENGLEAKQFLLNNTDHKCEIIFLDINMPVMNGFEFLDWFEHEYKSQNKPSVVILSSSLAQSDLEKSKGYPSVLQHVEKPIDSGLLKSLEAGLGKA